MSEEHDLISACEAASTMGHRFKFQIPANATSFHIESNAQKESKTHILYKCENIGNRFIRKLKEESPYNQDCAGEIPKVLGIDPLLVTRFSIGGGTSDILYADIKMAVTRTQFEQILTLLKGETK